MKKCKNFLFRSTLKVHNIMISCKNLLMVMVVGVIASHICMKHGIELSIESDNASYRILHVVTGGGGGGHAQEP